jgi:hypothetical protein
MPGMRRIDTVQPVCRPNWRSCDSACTRRRARSVAGATARVSSKGRAAAVTIHTRRAGVHQSRTRPPRARACIRARVRGSVRRAEAAAPGAARHRPTRPAGPAWPARPGCPANGTAPCWSQHGLRSAGDELRASTRQRGCKRRSTRWPTSPQPTMSSVGRRGSKLEPCGWGTIDLQFTCHPLPSLPTGWRRARSLLHSCVPP